MNSLPTDLLNLITYHLSTSESIFFGFKVKDCQEYIDVFGDDERFKIALKRKELKWIHETISKTDPTKGLKNALKYGYFWLINYFMNRLSKLRASAPKPQDDNNMSGYLYATGHNDLLKKIYFKVIINADSRPYIYGKRGIVDKEIPRGYEHHFVRGLATGQHKELFDVYACKLLKDRYTYNSYLTLFNDEQYIIDRLDMFDQQLLAVLISRKLFRVVSVYLKHCQHKFENLLHSNDIYELNGTPLYQLLLKKKISMVKDFKGTFNPNVGIIKIYLFIACLNSDIEGLDFIYDHCEEDRQLLLEYTEKYCMSDRIHTHKQLRTPKNMRLFDLIDKIRPYIDECVNDYIDFHNNFLYTNVDVSIFQGLIECYAEHNNMKAIRELFQIAIDYFSNRNYELCNILFSREVLNAPFFKKINSYRYKKLNKLQTKANLLGIQIDGLDESELIIEIFKTKILW